MHSTNYTNTFIEVAADCKTEVGKIPPEKQEKTIARMQYELIHEHPYQYTSDEIIFAVYATKNGIEPAARSQTGGVLCQRPTLSAFIALRQELRLGHPF